MHISEEEKCLSYGEVMKNLNESCHKKGKIATFSLQIEYHLTNDSLPDRFCLRVRQYFLPIDSTNI